MPSRRSATTATAGLALALIAGAVAPAAFGATLHVAPHRIAKGSATLPCAAERPCNLAFALASAGPGDDVLLAPGDYNAPVLNPLVTQGPYTETLVVTPGVVVHGEPGAALPVIHSRVQQIAPAVQVMGGAVLRDVAIEATAKPAAAVNYGYGVSVLPEGLVERSRIRWTGVDGTVGIACSMAGGTLRDSECLGTGVAGEAHALMGSRSGNVTYAVRNVTAITTNPRGNGVRVGTSNSVATMTVSNVIARGPAGDLKVRVGINGGVATMVVNHSNWTTEDVSAVPGGTAQLIRGAGNQTGPTAATPLFADAAAGDFRTTAGSPTIDAGLTDPSNGPLAFGGRSRAIGASTDIGADEFAPPAPPAAPAPQPAGSPATASAAAPVITGLRIAPSWTRRAGTTIRFTLSEDATVRLTFARRITGRRVGRACRPTTAANRTGTRCTRSILRGSRVLPATAGANAVTFTGSLPKGRVLTVGAHLLRATAIDATGDVSAPRTARFSIRR